MKSGEAPDDHGFTEFDKALLQVFVGASRVQYGTHAGRSSGESKPWRRSRSNSRDHRRVSDIEPPGGHCQLFRFMTKLLAPRGCSTISQGRYQPCISLHVAVEAAFLRAAPGAKNVSADSHYNKSYSAPPDQRSRSFPGDDRAQHEAEHHCGTRLRPRHRQPSRQAERRQ